MVSIILLDNHPLDAATRNVLTNQGVQGSYEPRPAMHFVLQHGNVPYVVFESAADEQRFLNFLAMAQNGNQMHVFTETPFTELMKFYNRAFRDVGVQKNLAFKVIPYAMPNDAFVMYSQRLITIQAVGINTFALNAENRIESVIGFDSIGTDAEWKSFKCYPDPIFHVNTDVEAIITNFFKPGKFPLALPGGNTTEVDHTSYFNKRDIAIRKKLTAPIDSTVQGSVQNLAPQSVAYHLLKLCEKPAYREFLKEGAHWSMEAVSDLALSRLEGKTKLIFRYYQTGKDKVTQWRNGILKPKNNDTKAVIDVKNAIAGDLDIADISEANAKDRTGFFAGIRTFPPGRYAYSDNGSMGWIKSFYKNSLDCNNADREYMDALLSPYESENGSDDITVMEAFNEHFFKCPLEDWMTNAWNEIILKFFIGRKGVYTLQDIFAEYNIAHCNDVRNMVMSDIKLKCDKSENIPALRLLLPLNTTIELTFSNILDTTNCLLGNNLILA